jgi:hypothetical protein
MVARHFTENQSRRYWLFWAAVTAKSGPNLQNGWFLHSRPLQFRENAIGVQWTKFGAPIPAAKGPFSMIMRLYWSKEAATDGKWKQPPLQRVT